MRRVTIAVDPELEPWRPEIGWSWRTILSTIGWSWEEVGHDAACDILYAPTRPVAGRAALWVRAEPQKWENWPALAGVHQAGALCLPRYAGEPSGPEQSARALPHSEAETQATVIERDIVFDLFWMATGGAEQGVAQDKHGNLQLPLEAVAGAPQRTLWLEAAAASVIACIEVCGQALGWPEPTPRWPGGAVAAAAAGHDVDYPEVVRWLEPLRIVARRGRTGLRPAWEVATGARDHWRFEQWMECEEALGSRSVFFFVPRQGSLPEYLLKRPDPFYDVTAPRFRALFRTLAERGFEVGLHASYDAWRSVESFRAERARLEEAAGGPVVGNRHHYWHMQPGAPDETLLLHAEAGLLYDTSLTNDRYIGWRRGLCAPYAPFHRRTRRPVRTLQIGTAWMDDQLFGAAAHNPGDPTAHLHALAERTKRMGGCLLIDIHDYVFDDCLYPGWRAAYVALWQHLRTLGGFWFATPAEIARHWCARAERIAAHSVGLGEGASMKAAVLS